MEQICKNCKKFRMKACNVFKEEGKYPGPNDYCYGFKPKPKTTITEKTYTKEQVLRVVDALFHAFASDYRCDAKEEAVDILERMKGE